MKKLLFLVAAILILNGCNMQKQKDEPGFPPAMTEKPADGEIPSDEDMIIGAKNQIRLDLEPTNLNSDIYSKEEAAQLLKNHLQRPNDDSLSISYEGFRIDHYLFQVESNQQEKAHRERYSVNPKSGHVTLIKD